ncbi:Nuclear-interacting partner of ALK [Nowakowskiella sp. JEL0078]|nr:Nuclear-interacting partner of ALK [Nowakowskiella sp. JEL0078]
MIYYWGQYPPLKEKVLFSKPDHKAWLFDSLIVISGLHFMLPTINTITKRKCAEMFAALDAVLLPTSTEEVKSEIKESFSSSPLKSPAKSLTSPRKFASNSTLNSPQKQTKNQSTEVTVSLSDKHLAARLSTFSELKWFGKPNELSPVVCSRFGWENVSSDTLGCSLCNTRLIIRIENLGGENDFDSASFRKNLFLFLIIYMFFSCIFM